jgi:hypothetical protein
MKNFLLLVTVTALSGCAMYPANQPFPLAPADPYSVRECRPVGRYPGPYGYSYWGPPPVLGDFKYRTAVTARDAGATHIYWREEILGIRGETRIVGHAFDCTGVSMPNYDGTPGLY